MRRVALEWELPREADRYVVQCLPTEAGTTGEEVAPACIRSADAPDVEEFPADREFSRVAHPVDSVELDDGAERIGQLVVEVQVPGKAVVGRVPVRRDSSAYRTEEVEFVPSLGERKKEVALRV